MYWAWKSGYEFEIIGGYEWETSYEYQELILGLFKLRVAAKESGNTCLQQSIKLILNSLFGIHSQRVIRSVDKVLTLPEGLRTNDVLEEEFSKYIRANHQKIFDPRIKLKENIPMANGQSLIRGTIPGDIGEAVGGYSPNQIGCAVLAWSRHIMNLAMFEVPLGHLTYTDTDSLAVTEVVYDYMKSKAIEAQETLGVPPLIMEKGNELMTYKNDHSDYFPNARVLFSAIGAKKVKMHIIGCPDSGELKVCCTFKGFLKKDTLDSGDKLHPHHHEYTMSKALLDILYDGKPEPYIGTRWTKSIGDVGGVKIDRSVRVEGESFTYLGKHKAFLFAKHQRCPSSVIVNVPFGCTSTCTGPAVDGIDGEDATYVTPIEYISKTDGQARLSEYSLPPIWRTMVELYSGGVTRTEMYDFIEKMFHARQDLSLIHI